VPVQRNAFSRRTSIHAAAAVLANKCNPLSYRLDSVVIFSSTPDFSRLSGTLVYAPQRTHTDKDITLCVLVLSLQKKTVRELLLSSENVCRDDNADCCRLHARDSCRKKYILTTSTDVQITVLVI